MVNFTRPPITSPMHPRVERALIRALCDRDYIEDPTIENPFHPTEVEYYYWQERRNEIDQSDFKPSHIPDIVKLSLKEFFR